MDDFKFYSYPEIRNNFDLNYIQSIVPENELWIATEKVHGANFSIYLNKDGSYKCGRRSDFLGPDEFFYNYKQIIENEKLILKLIKVFSDLKIIYPHLEQIIFYGEICGGYYPDYKYNVNLNYAPKRVQKEVHYCPENKIIIFDIRLLLSDQRTIFVDYTDVVKFCTQFDILHCPIIEQGPLNTIYYLNHDFESQIYKLFHLPELENNKAEGIVIRPNKSCWTPRQQRIIIKKKIEAFMEVKQNATGQKKQIDYTKVNEIYDQIKHYCTLQRYQNVKSHIDPDKFEKFSLNEKMKLLVNDMIQEYFRDKNESINKKVLIKLKQLLYNDALSLIEKTDK